MQLLYAAFFLGFELPERNPRNKDKRWRYWKSEYIYTLLDRTQLEKGKRKRKEEETEQTGCYLSNTTQLAWARLASAATAPHGDPETIFILTLICAIKLGIKALAGKDIYVKQSYNHAPRDRCLPCLDHKHHEAGGSFGSRYQLYRIFALNLIPIETCDYHWRSPQQILENPIFYLEDCGI